MTNDSKKALIGQTVRVWVDGREVLGTIMEPSRKYPSYPRVFFNVSGDRQCLPFTWLAVVNARENDTALIA